LNIVFGINNEKQDCKIGPVSMGGTCVYRGMKRGDEDEGIGSLGFIYTKEIEQ
jgi:hypothetical protein